jgi:hypothetical protein
LGEEVFVARCFLYAARAPIVRAARIKCHKTFIYSNLRISIAIFGRPRRRENHVQISMEFAGRLATLYAVILIFPGGCRNTPVAAKS